MTEPGKPELLIVDDDPVILDTLSYVLGEDFTVTHPPPEKLIRY